MNFLEYRENVKRTLPTLGEFKGNPIILDSIHMTLGMCSELYELCQGALEGDAVNVAEELTDIAWYASNYCNIRGFEVEGLYGLGFDNKSSDNEKEWSENLEALTLAISELQDYDKKEFAYNKLETEEIKTNRLNCIEIVFSSLNILYAVAEQDAEKSMQNNIDKLRKRFPDKFNEHDANNRNLSEERKELEK